MIARQYLGSGVHALNSNFFYSHQFKAVGLLAADGKNVGILVEFDGVLKKVFHGLEGANKVNYRIGDLAGRRLGT